MPRTFQSKITSIFLDLVCEVARLPYPARREPWTHLEFRPRFVLAVWILYPVSIFPFFHVYSKEFRRPSRWPKLSPLSVMIPTEGLHAKRIMIHTSKTLPFCMLRRTRLQRTDAVLQRFQCGVCTACRRARMTFACKKVGRCWRRCELDTNLS